MTRPEKISKRKTFNKALRARASEEKTSFASVLIRTQSVQGTRPYRAMLNLPTHPIRPMRRNMMDARHNDTSDLENYDTEDEEGDVDQKKDSTVIDLMAIAKPAKVKGVARDFEFVKVRNVIVLEDQDAEIEFGDEWETIDFDEGTTTERSYSAALSGR